MATDRLAGDLERIAALDPAALRQRWRRVFGCAATPGLPRALLVGALALAYRVQAEALGDLDRQTQAALERMAADGTLIPIPALPETKPGTLLVREWQGRMHNVMILAEGFAWNGETYRSLSEVAFIITGTKWSGLRFFGLKGKG